MEPVAHMTGQGLSKDALNYAQIPVLSMGMGKRMGHGQAQVLPSLESRADAAAAAIIGGLAAGVPLGSIPVRSGC